MSKIVLVKLVSGEELVCVVQNKNDFEVNLINPSFVVHNGETYDLAPFSPWAKFNDTSMRVFTIKEDHIMFISEVATGAVKLYELYHVSGKAVSDSESEVKKDPVEDIKKELSGEKSLILPDTNTIQTNAVH
jgi:hypothetical protein